MYNGVNDENNESSFNSDENLYHYSYSKDQAPQPGQPDPSQTSWQPAPRPEPQAAQEDQTSCTTGDYQDEPRIPRTNGTSFWKNLISSNAIDRSYEAFGVKSEKPLEQVKKFYCTNRQFRAP